MKLFKVWAPRAEAVSLALLDRNEDILMEKRAGDWWEIEIDDARHGERYFFVLNGEKQPNGGARFPDPRSEWQPEGVHGPSAVVDHDRFNWSDQGWHAPPIEAAVFYEIHVGTFTSEGTFESAIERLDYLVDLGVTHLELMPVVEFPGKCGWGYDGVDLFAPHNAYGGPDGLKALVDACHRRGLAVVLDVVYNHLGPDGNYLSQFGPYFTGRYSTPWGEAVNYEGTGSDQVRRFFIDNAHSWFKNYHIDALRLDAVHSIHDQSAYHFLEHLADETALLSAQLGRQLSLIAESDLNDPRLIRPAEIGGYGLDAQWNDDFHHALHALLTGEQDGYYQGFGRVEHLAKSLRHGYVFTGEYSPFRGRRHGRPASGIPAHRFLGYLQNHDQIGNRARGERISHLVSKGKQKIGAALLLTGPFLPLLFQGEEWAASSPFLFFTDHQEPELAEAVRKGRRKEFASFGWDPERVPDPQAEATFMRSKLDWGELEQEPHREILEWHRHLIRLRGEQPALHSGWRIPMEILYNEEQGWLVFRRGDILTAVNLSQEEQRIPVPAHAALSEAEVLAKTGEIDLLLTSENGISIEDNALLLPGESAAVALLVG
jgi:maltooligosyltrehalose trehalohydrolase